MKSSTQLINDLRAGGVITEEFRLTLLIAIENEKLDLEKGHLEEVKQNFNAIKASLS